MAFFEKQERISRKEFRRTFKKSNPILPGTGRKLFSLPERVKIEEELFGKKVDASASKEKYKRFVSRMRLDKYRAKDLSRKRTIDKKIRVLKKLGGV